MAQLRMKPKRSPNGPCMMSRDVNNVCVWFIQACNLAATICAQESVGDRRLFSVVANSTDTDLFPDGRFLINPP